MIKTKICSIYVYICFRFTLPLTSINLVVIVVIYSASRLPNLASVRGAVMTFGIKSRLDVSVVRMGLEDEHCIRAPKVYGF